MSDEATAPANAAPAAAPESAPASGANPSPSPESTPQASPAPEGAPNAQEAGDAVSEAMESQGVDNPDDLDWSRQVKVTVDGTERTVPLSELRGNYELRRSSFERFEEAKRLREQAKSQEARLKEIANALKDPAMAPAVLRELGYQPDQLQAVMDSIRAELELPEDQKRMRELERREQAIAERERAYRAKLQREQAQKDQQMFRSAFNEALDPHGLKNDRAAIHLMATYLDHRYPRNPGARLTEAEVSKLATEAASYAAEEIVNQRRKAIADIDPSQLSKLLPPEHLEALRARRVEEYQRGQAPKPSGESKPKRKSKKEKVRMNSLADFRAVLEGED